MTNQGELAVSIAQIYKEQKNENIDFKIVQRRVYDAINIMCSLKFIKKDQGNIVW